MKELNNEAVEASGCKDLFGGDIIETPDGVSTFVCERCGHHLPRTVEHEEKPGVCVLDYVSEKDQERINRIVHEVMTEAGYAMPSA